ncbi:DUF6414 family protein [Haladaptatus cibarius]|uniref:DUF6414 family protein n=1 Tax=Haladaptatus cibarius TaxID=453847 RepID=UPI0006797435|nr:hypothetical protein [Haladaptatus cibarius]
MGIKTWLSKLWNGQEKENQSLDDEPSDQDLVEDSVDENSGLDTDEHEYERELREFVYLDRDSVVSLLASIEGAIKQERIEQIGSRSEDRVSGGINASISGVGAKVEGERVEMGENSSEVVHNYAIQSLFDQLDQHRRNDVDLGVLDTNKKDEIDISEIERSDVLRVDVELKTHYLYRFYTVMMYIQENIPESVGLEEEDTLELIESMFGSEVPVSGRVLDYQVKNGRIQPVESDNPDGEPLHIVGQLNTMKLWQDIPDALFDGGEYTVFCRVKELYEDEPWRPLSLAQKIETVSPPLAQALTQFMERASALAEEEASEQYSGDADLDQWMDALTEFDDRAGIDNRTDTLHREFMTEYVLENGIPALTPSGSTELVNFYKEYAIYLREHNIDLSKGDEAEATDRMIFSEHQSMGDRETRTSVDGLQIESQIVAIYW